MNQDKIVVVMGGTSTEAEVSRRTGTAILNALKSKGYNAEGMELVPQTFANDIQKTGCANRSEVQRKFGLALYPDISEVPESAIS